MNDNALGAPSEPALTHARPVAVETLGLEIVEVILKASLSVLSEIAQKTKCDLTRFAICRVPAQCSTFGPLAFRGRVLSRQQMSSRT